MIKPRSYTADVYFSISLLLLKDQRQGGRVAASVAPFVILYDYLFKDSEEPVERGR